MAKSLIHITPIGKGYNIGNFAISLAIRKLLQEIYRDVTVVTYPAHGTTESGLNKKIIYEANQWCDGIIVGGGNLYENNELYIDFNALESLRVPLVLFSISLGKIYSKGPLLARRTDVMPNNYLINLHKYSSNSLTRDIATQSHMESIGIRNSILGGCPTLRLNQLVKKESLPKFEDKKVLISIRNPELMNIPRSLKTNMPSIVSNICSLVKRKYKTKPLLLCHDQRDIGFASSFSDAEFYFTSDIYEYLGLLNSSDLLISMRVHATLPCLSYGVPVINLSYDERGISLLKTIGYSSWDINLVEEESNVENLLVDRMDNLNKLKSMRESSAMIWDELLKIQFDVLRSFE